MRVRTATATVSKVAGLDPLFVRAADRHVAWVAGSGRVYADLERVAKKHGYRIFVPESDTSDYWFAVRSDLVVDESWDVGMTQVRFDPTKRALGSVLLNSDPDFNFGDRVLSVQDSSEVEFDGYSYGERLFTVQPSKD